MLLQRFQNYCDNGSSGHMECISEYVSYGATPHCLIAALYLSRFAVCLIGNERNICLIHSSGVCLSCFTKTLTMARPSQCLLFADRVNYADKILETLMAKTEGKSQRAEEIHSLVKDLPTFSILLKEQHLTSRLVKRMVI